MTVEEAARAAVELTAETAVSAGVAAKAGNGLRSELQRAPWLVALDVDGTVMHEDETIDPAVVAAVAGAVERGHLVTLATGRSWASTHPVLRQLGLAPEYVVCANGAIVMQRDAAASDLAGEPVYLRAHVETFDPSAVLERIRAFLPDGKFLVELPDGFRLYTHGMVEWNLENAREVEFAELLGQHATRVVATSREHGLEEFFALVEQMGLHHVSYAIGWTAWLDIAPDGVNKATALERVVGWLGHPADRVLAVGDGRNDIEMFRWAGVEGRAVAMGQAPGEVKDAAGEVAASVAEAGLAAVLDSLP